LVRTVPDRLGKDVTFFHPFPSRSLTDERQHLQDALGPAYTVEREIGRGGMAVVYLAHDVKHDRQVALKVIRSDVTFPGAAVRFSREIKLAARLQHPHILPVHDSGEAADQLWYTMPFVDGESLRDRLARDKQLPIADAIRIAREAALALEYAHQHGVIHRDIKPENLLLTEDGSVLVADFGIARALAGDNGSAQTTGATTRVTEVGIAIGTPAYMAPEQAMGEPNVDGRADLYALGAVLYEMVGGEPPFTGATSGAIMARSLTESPRPLSQSRAGVTPALDAAIAKALAKNPSDRFASGQALVTSLDAVLDAMRTGSRPDVAPGRRASRALRLTTRRLLLLVASALGLISALVVGWRQYEGNGPTEIHLAVLPFENRGAAEDAYFADGIADELRGKLAGLPGFRIAARTSSDQYRQSAKRPGEIGRELGVTYLLNATVRWAKASDGSSRVQVVPELVRTTTGEIAWQQPFEADLTDIFQVQAQIAGQVAGALGAVLGSSDQRRLAKPPTTDLAAYDLFLRADAVRGVGQSKVRERISLLEQAVARDSAFAVAWASLSSNLSGLYQNGAPDTAVAARSLAAAERAILLTPDAPAGYQALADYHYSVTRDAARAEEQALHALKLAPYNANLLGTAAKIERQTGQFEAAVRHLQRARRLDPRSIGTLNVMQTTLLWLRRYPEALAASDSLLARRPGDLSFTQDKSMVYLAQGDLRSARALIAGLSPATPDSTVAAYFSYYWDMYWVLDDAQQRRVLQLSATSFDGDRAAWATTLMQLYWFRGDSVKARAYADTSYVENLRLMRAAPNDAQRKVLVGLALAYLGRKDDAIAEGIKGTALAPLSTDKINGPYYQHQLARIYLLVGEPEKAIDQLEPLLATPYYLSSGWLQLDPTFASLKGNPRYDRLVARGPKT
jgi:serine/threonine-protein kinase